MEEVLRPIYEKVEKILKGEELGTVNIGVSDAFNQVSHEFIGYGCFSETIFNALLISLEDKLMHLRQGGLIKSEEMFVPSGRADSDVDVAYELSTILFPSVFDLIHDKGDGVVKVVDSMYAFVPCDKFALDNVFEVLGDTFRAEYSKLYSDDVPTNTEKLYNRIMNILPF